MIQSIQSYEKRIVFLRGNIEFLRMEIINNYKIIEKLNGRCYYLKKLLNDKKCAFKNIACCRFKETYLWN